MQLVDFAEQHLGVDHHALAQDTVRPLTQDATRQQAYDDLLVAYDQRVAGVRAARVAHHDVGKLHVNIDDFAFTFVAPLSTDNDHRRHVLSHGCYSGTGREITPTPGGVGSNYSLELLALGERILFVRRGRGPRTLLGARRAARD